MPERQKKIFSKNIFTLLLYAATLFFPFAGKISAQFGQNKIQYRNHDWFYVETKHFNVFFDQDGFEIADFIVKAAEDALAQIEKDLDYNIRNRITIILYDSHNEFQQTNTTESFLSTGVGGFTEPFKNRVVIPFEGDWKKYRHVIHHELVHAVMQDMIYGGSLQNAIAHNINLNLPIWVHEGMAEFLSSTWETNSDMFIRDAIINEYLPDVNRLGGYYAYRGGEALFYYIARNYGRAKVGEILKKTQDVGNLEQGLKLSIGLTLEELNNRWKKWLKKIYWPEVEYREDPEDFAKRLTNARKVKGYYNTSPAISPQGDKIVFISDRDIYYDIYLMDDDGKNVEKIIETGNTIDFEELNILFPLLAWAPDNRRIALAEKSEGFDKIAIYDTETDETVFLPFEMRQIGSISWSPDGNKIAFSASNAKQSDIYFYDFQTDSVYNLTDDVFTDRLPRWAPDSKSVIFSSDRKSYLNKKDIPENFRVADFDYSQLDLYILNTETGKIERLTDWKYSDEMIPVFSEDGKEIIFISDKNGINNLYRKRIVLNASDSAKTLLELPAKPITNSLNEINQISISADGKKLVFSTHFKEAYDIFEILNPFEIKPKADTLRPTKFIAELASKAACLEDTIIMPLSRILTDDEFETDVDSLSERDNSFAEISDTTNDDIFTGNFIEEETPAINDYSHYIFGRDTVIALDSTRKYAEKIFHENLDKNGNYAVKRYKVHFTPDLVNASMTFSSYYGLLGYTMLTYSDMLGDHQLVGALGLQMDLKNSDYGLAYYYLPKRTDWRFEIYHTARFVYVANPETYYIDLHRYQNLSFSVEASYPLNRFFRLGGSFSFMRLTAENLDDYSMPVVHEYYFVPGISAVHDNTMWGYYSPIQGTRYRVSLFGNLGLTDSKQAFYTFVWDYRRYFRFFFDNSFVLRFSGGYSGGANPQRFFVGGTEGWLNRTWATPTIPLNRPSDFVFLSPGLPLRGFRYAERIGNKYALLNLELRFPFIRALFTGGIPLAFQNILGVAFLDVGSAWFDDVDLRLTQILPNGERVFKDVLTGAGLGLRTYFLFMWRWDVAWRYDLRGWSKPVYYWSFGFDF